LSDTAVKAAAGFVAFKGGQLVANFARDAIEAGRDLQVNLNGLQSVFGESTGKMIDFSKGMSSMGLTMAEAAKASTFIGSVLKQSGFAMDEVTKQTQFLIKAAADLSLTFGYDVQESLLAMTALFRGAYDPIEKFGVAMKQSEIEGVKLERELDKLTGSAERFADATIRLELFTERSTDSLGAYERQANTLRVVQDQLRASFGNMEQILGAAMLPTVRDLTLSLIPLVETIGPVLAAAMQAVVPLLVSFSQNTEQIVSVLLDAIKAIAATVMVMSFLAKMLVENAELIINVAKVVLVLGGTLYSLRVGVSVMKTVRDAVAAFGVTIVKTTRTLNLLKLALIGIPIIGWIAALTTIGLVAYDISQAATEAGESLDEMFDEQSILQGAEDFKTLQEEVAATAGAFDEVTEAGGAAKDAVGDFYRKLSDEIDKQRAKLSLQQMGASDGLIQSILGSGEDWQRVFNDVVSRGIAGVQDVQKLFRATAAGLMRQCRSGKKNTASRSVSSRRMRLLLVTP